LQQRTENGKQSTPSASLVAPVSGGQSVTTDICENPVASALSVFNSPLTKTNGTISGEQSVTTEQLTANEWGTEMLKNQKKKNKKGPFALFKRVCILPLCTKFYIFVTRTICDQTKIKLL
jgi:hypothetical protein